MSTEVAMDEIEQLNQHRGTEEIAGVGSDVTD